MAIEFLSFRHSLTCLRNYPIILEVFSHHITKYVDKHYKLPKQFEQVF